MGIPTHEDAKLMLELYRLRLDPNLKEAQRWFLAEFQPAPWDQIQRTYATNSPEWSMLVTVLGYWEIVGSLIDHNLLSEDLVFDSLESLGVEWEKVSAWLPGARQAMGIDQWENVEILTNRHAHWKQHHRPKSERL